MREHGPKDGLEAADNIVANLAEIRERTQRERAARRGRVGVLYLTGEFALLASGYSAAESKHAVTVNDKWHLPLVSLSRDDMHDVRGQLGSESECSALIASVSPAREHRQLLAPAAAVARQDRTREARRIPCLLAICSPAKQAREAADEVTSEREQRA